jgi:hypothetical protein
VLGAVTVKKAPLVAVPFTVTCTLPLLAPLGTCTRIELGPQLIAVAFVPLKVTELLPWLGPKLTPLIVTEVPTMPSDGVKPLIAGV